MLTPDVIFQIYRGGVPGDSARQKRDRLANLVIRLRVLGFSSVAFHGFAREMVGAWPGLASLANGEGMAALACYGLDGETDGGKPFTGTARGELIGEVSSQPTCAATVLDAEGRYDDADAGRPGDVTDTDDVLDLGAALRKKAPTALVGTQHWYALLSHGDLRKTPVSGKPRDVFKGFPQDAFSEFCNWFEFSQAYCNHAETKAAFGTRRYRVVFDRMAKDRAECEPVWKRAGLNWKPGVTIQGYGWDDIPHHCLDAMLTEVLAGRPIMVWCDWQPSPVVLACANAVHFLRDRGYLQPGRTARDVIRAYQVDYNRTASGATVLTADGYGGAKTLLTMGLSLG